MNRKRRTQILIEDQTGLCLQLAEKAEAQFTIEVREPAHLGLMMSQVRESAQLSVFYLGEVLITRARVVINQQTGLGLICGEQSEKALALATVDAAYPLLSDSERNSWNQLLLKAEETCRLQQSIRQQQVAQTKVSFNTMEVED